MAYLQRFLPAAKDAIHVLNGVQRLNCEAFRKTVTVPALRHPKRLGAECKKLFGSHTFGAPSIGPIVKDAEGEAENTFLLLLQPEVSRDVFPPLVTDLLSRGIARLDSYDVVLTVKDFPRALVADLVVPDDDLSRIKSFSKIGHIALIPYADRNLDHMQLLADVIMATESGIRTVVRRASETSGSDRLSVLEHLAGERDYQATETLGSCQFPVDLTKVFWNPKQNEFRRITSLLKPQDVLCDMFAGCAPFPIFAARHKKCRAYANDMNVHCAAAVTEAIKLNRLHGLVSCFNLDARVFLPHLMAKILWWHSLGDTGGKVNNTWPMFTHVVMNLPRTAISFLDVFRGLLVQAPDFPLPMIHVYFMCKASGRDRHVQEAHSVLNVDSLGTEMDVYQCHDYAPGSYKHRLSFRLPGEVAFSPKPQTSKLSTGFLILE